MSETRKHVAARSAKPDEGELLRRFRYELHSGRGGLTMSLWKKHMKIRHAYAGKSQLALSDIVLDFYKLMDLKITPIVEYIWRDNKKLHAWFCHEEVDGSYIDWQSLIQLFECAVLHGQANIANAIWKQNATMLQAWYEGRAYAPPSDERTKQTIEIFKASLFFKMVPVMHGICRAAEGVILAYYKNLFSAHRDLFYSDFLFYSQYPNSKIVKGLAQINQIVMTTVEIKTEIKEEPVEVKIDAFETKRKVEDEAEGDRPRKILKRENMGESVTSISPPATPSQMGFFSENVFISPPPVECDDLLPLPPLTEEQLDLMCLNPDGFYF